MATFRVGQSRVGALDRLVLGGSSVVAILVAQAMYLRGLETNINFGRSAYLGGTTPLQVAVSDYLAGTVATIAAQAEYLFSIEALPAQRAAYLKSTVLLAATVADFCAGIEALNASRAAYLLAPTQVVLASTLGVYARGLQAVTSAQLSAYLASGLGAAPVAIMATAAAYLAGWIPPLGFAVIDVDADAGANILTRAWSAGPAVLTQSAGHIAEKGV